MGLNMVLSDPACQSCGETIRIGEKVVRVQYGTLGVTAHPHLKVTGRAEVPDDYFHATCPVAIRDLERMKEVVA